MELLEGMPLFNPHAGEEETPDGACAEDDLRDEPPSPSRHADEEREEEEEEDEEADDFGEGAVSEDVAGKREDERADEVGQEGCSPDVGSCSFSRPSTS